MAHPAGLPDLFIDRSLGRIQVPKILRGAGLRLVTLAEHYGMPQDEKVLDITWLADVGALGWVVFMKDERIRHNPSEKAAIMAYKIRCFCLTRQDLRAAEMANCFLHNLPAIERACQKPGPFLYAVQADRIVQML